MGLLDNYGHGPHNLGMTPRPNFEHQLMISKIIRNLGALDHGRNLLILPETRVTHPQQKEYAPDVVIYDKQNFINGEYQPSIIIEIEKTARIKANISKVKEIYNLVPSIREAFVYDYEKQIWYFVSPDSQVYESSNSLILGIEIGKWVRL